MNRIAAAAVAVGLAVAGCGEDNIAPVADDPLTSSPTSTAPAPATTESSPTSASASSPDASVGASADHRPSEIPASFPLAAGWPRRTGEPGYRGLDGPNRTLPALEFAPCDAPAVDPEFTDRLRADWSDIVDFRSRQLTAYRTEEAAASALIAIVDTYQSCPEHQSNDEFTTHYALTRTTYGDESWSVASTETQADGYSTSYLEVLHFVRVGQAILVDTDYGEGGAAPPGMLEHFVARPIADATAVIDAMCVFRAAECARVGD